MRNRLGRATIQSILAEPGDAIASKLCSAGNQYSLGVAKATGLQGMEEQGNTPRVTQADHRDMDGGGFHGEKGTILSWRARNSQKKRQKNCMK